MGSCIELQRSRGESLSESQPRSPISIIWHDSWQQEQPIRRTNRYIHTEWCVGWLFLFHHPCLFGLSPVRVHRPARSETRYQYRTVHRSVGPLRSGRLSPRTRRSRRKREVNKPRVRGARWARVECNRTRDLVPLDNPRPVHLQSVTYSSGVAMFRDPRPSDVYIVTQRTTEPQATARTRVILRATRDLHT